MNWTLFVTLLLVQTIAVLADPTNGNKEKEMNKKDASEDPDVVPDEEIVSSFFENIKKPDLNGNPTTENIQAKIAEEHKAEVKAAAANEAKKCEDGDEACAGERSFGFFFPRPQPPKLFCNQIERSNQMCYHAYQLHFWTNKCEATDCKFKPTTAFTIGDRIPMEIYQSYNYPGFISGNACKTRFKPCNRNTGNQRTLGGQGLYWGSFCPKKMCVQKYKTITKKLWVKYHSKLSCLPQKWMQKLVYIRYPDRCECTDVKFEECRQFQKCQNDIRQQQQQHINNQQQHNQNYQPTTQPWQPAPTTQQWLAPATTQAPPPPPPSPYNPNPYNPYGHNNQQFQWQMPQFPFQGQYPGYPYLP